MAWLHQIKTYGRKKQNLFHTKKITINTGSGNRAVDTENLVDAFIVILSWQKLFLTIYGKTITLFIA